MTFPTDATTGLPVPVPGCIVTQLYGPENTDPEVRPLYRKGYHTGIDFSGAPEGTAVLSTTDGTVSLAGTNAGYGECVVVGRSDGIEVLFGHLSRIDVQVGQQVAVGQALGGIGTTGVSTGVHLHLEYRQNGDDIDPTPFLQAGLSGQGAPAAPAAVPTPGRPARTTVNANFREQPAEDAPILGVVPAGAAVTLRRDAYYPVRWNGRDGWLWGGFLELLGDDADAGIVDPGAPAGFLRGRPDLMTLPLVPAPAEQIAAATGTDAEQLIAETWNRYGGLLAILANELRIDPGIAASVLAIEAGGRAFGADGRMIIRFENHIFFDEWGKQNPDAFSQRFSFDGGQPWLGQLWRPSPAEPWREFHGDQAAEWQVLGLACGLDDTAAKRSISMGAPQIMGFNHAAIGYGSVQEMFDAFSRSEQAQLIGFFDFVQGGSAGSPAVVALQNQDFTAFATQYNGSGQAATYGARMAEVYNAFQRLRSA
jgi:hypothetical protein